MENTKNYESFFAMYKSKDIVYPSAVAVSYTHLGMPYDFFCNVGYCWNIKKFKDMTYDDFTKFVEASLARQLRKLDGSIGTDNRFYDVLWLASKEPETKWNLEF